MSRANLVLASRAPLLCALLPLATATPSQAQPEHVPPRRTTATGAKGAGSHAPAHRAAAKSRSGAARLEPDATLPATKLRLRVITADEAKPVPDAHLTLQRGATRQLAKTGADGSVVVDWPAGSGPLKVELRYQGIGYASSELTAPRPSPASQPQPKRPRRATTSSGPATARSQPATARSQPATASSRPPSSSQAATASARPTTTTTSGLRLTFTVFRKTGDTSKLKLVRGTHLLARAGEAGVGFLQVFALQNGSRMLIDTGKPGLRIPLPDGAIAPQLGPAAKRFAQISADGRAVVITRPIPPGSLGLRVSYDLRSVEGTLDFSQRLVLDLDASVVAITNSDQVDVHGPGVSRRVLDGHGGGRPLSFFDIKGIPAGRRLELTLTQLPYRDPTLKWVLIGGALLIVLWALFASISAGRGRKRREEQRAALIDQLARLDLAQLRGELDEATYRAERDPLRAQLEQLWG